MVVDPLATWTRTAAMEAAGELARLQEENSWRARLGRAEEDPSMEPAATPDTPRHFIDAAAAFAQSGSKGQRKWQGAAKSLVPAPLTSPGSQFRVRRHHSFRRNSPR